MHEEIDMINQNNTWSLVDIPENHHVIEVNRFSKRSLTLTVP